MANRSSTKTQVTEMRRKMRKWGATPELLEEATVLLKARCRLRDMDPVKHAREIQDLAEKLDFVRLQARLGMDAARSIVYEKSQRRLQFDDRGFKPSTGDSLLRGVGRATGETAKAVKRGRTLAKWEHVDG
jgi:hypothetical protein